MKAKSAILILIFAAALASCADLETPLTPGLITEVKAYDLGTNANGSDIRVDFDVRNSLNVDEYRIMVIPPNSSASFDLSAASSTPISSYVEVVPVPFEESYSVRLTAVLLDVNGSPILEGQPYEIVVYIKGVGDPQLSDFSNPVTLIDQGPYSGIYYIGIDYPPCTRADGTLTGAGEFVPDGSYWIDVTGSGGDYSGTVRCNVCPPEDGTQGNMSFIITGNTIEVLWNWLLGVCNSSLCPGGTRCMHTMTGVGDVEDELVFRLATVEIQENFNVSSCMLTCTGDWSFFRQI